MRVSTRVLTGLILAAILTVVPITSAQDSSNQTAPVAPSHSKSKKKTKSSTSSHKTSGKGKKSHARQHGQQKIDGERAQQIQEALIREHYLSGRPSGVWDAATQEAMQKYQEDNGWQSKTTPDSRALIKLGLGPDHQHLLNPESAMTTQPAAAHGSAASSPSSAVDPSAGKSQQ